MARKRTKISTTAPWFVPGGHLVGVREDLLEVLRAMDGRSPREIRADQVLTPKADNYLDPAMPATEDDDDDEQLGGVAIVKAIGPITQYEGVCDWMFGGCSLEAFMEDMEEAAADDGVSSIVMLVDSPGGEAAGIADAADRVRLINAEKPVVALITGEGCSAGYWLASAAGKIVASQTAILGSIGIVMTYIDDSKADEAMGIRKVEFVSSVSPDKRMDPGSEGGKAKIQAVVDDYGEIFVSAVAGFRGVSTEKVKTDFGQGGVLVGAKALEAGLADQIGTLEDAVLLAQELAGAAGDSSTSGATRMAGTRDNADGGLMPEKKTAADLRAEHPDLVAEIAAEAALAERERIAAIQKYNTRAYRAFAAKEIDAAIADPKVTAGQLAVQILDAQSERQKKIAADRQEDSVDVETPEPHDPPDAVDAAEARHKAGKRSIDTDAVYARLNGQAPRRAN
jgi:signal peptide peptidase SppA